MWGPRAAGPLSIAGFDTSKRRSPGWDAMRMRTLRSSRVTTSRPGNAAVRAVTRCRPPMRTLEPETWLNVPVQAATLTSRTPHRQSVCGRPAQWRGGAGASKPCTARHVIVKAHPWGLTSREVPSTTTARSPWQEQRDFTTTGAQMDTTSAFLVSWCLGGNKAWPPRKHHSRTRLRAPRALTLCVSVIQMRRNLAAVRLASDRPALGASGRTGIADAKQNSVTACCAAGA